MNIRVSSKPKVEGDSFLTIVFTFCFSIPVQTYERTPKESELEKASEYIGPSFPLLRAVLELQGTEIDQVKLDNQVSSRTQICKMLVSWKNRNPHHATIGQFIEAVKETCPEADVEDFEQCFFSS